MRFFVGFVFFLLVLGTLRVVGCGDEGPECLGDEECDDQNECTTNYCFEESCHSEPVGASGHPQRCDFDGVFGIAGEDGICSEEGICVPSPCDDSNECTDDDGPHVDDGACFHYPCTGCGPCDLNGEPGVCIEGICAEDVCLSLVCDDGDPCTVDFCRSFPSAGSVVRCNTSPKNCGDGNERTSNACEPTTGECIHEPVPDGQECCLRAEWECGFCIPSCCEWVCVASGECDNGACLPVK